uniref:Transmembrane protein 186 n=1 Tax=Sphenodon punctatus TaxID=8508 RepID=A0A8D0HEF7_SPHPU
MAGFCTVTIQVRAIPAFGRCLQNGFAAGWWKQSSLCSPIWLGAHTSLQPQSRRTERTLQPGKGLAQYRFLSSLAQSRSILEKPTPENTEQFKVIYRFPGIRVCRVLSRLKLLQTGLTLIILPPVCFLYLQEQVSSGFFLYVIGVASFAATMLYGMSFFLRRLIGFMYLNDAGNMLKVSHLTFWGRRNDIFCPVETVMTLSDTGESENDILLPFKLSNSTSFLYFTLKHGQIVDKERFAQVFGA